MDRRLIVCANCAGEWVNPVDRSELDGGRWWISLRCGACETRREVIVTDDVANLYEDELVRSTELIADELRRLERLRMNDEVVTFIRALRRGLIEPADFIPLRQSIE